MATLINGIQFTGSIGNVSGYKRPGSGKIYVRSKGGATRHKIKTAPEFELTRQNNTEFGACGKAAGLLRKAIAPVAHLTAPGFNINARATIIVKALQQLDSEEKPGRRVIRFSAHRQMLEGFSLNPEQAFDSVVMPALYGNIDRHTGTAQLQLPALYPGVNLLLPWPYPVYRFIISLGALPDMLPAATGQYMPAVAKLPVVAAVYTGWQFVKEPYAGDSITVQLANPEYLDDRVSLLLSIGLEMGTPVTDNLIVAEKKKGCGKILKTG